MYELVNRKKIFVVNLNVFLLNLIRLYQRKGINTAKAANKLQKAVTIKKLADKNDSVLKVAKVIKNGKIKNHEMNLLCKTIGESIVKHFYENTK